MEVVEGCAGWTGAEPHAYRRRIMDKPIIYIGLDVHKETVAVAVAEGGKRGEVREHGKIANTAAAVTAFAVKLVRGGNACGFATRRALAAMAFNEN
jgi:hypothetical protein